VKKKLKGKNLVTRSLYIKRTIGPFQKTSMDFIFTRQSRRNSQKYLEDILAKSVLYKLVGGGAATGKLPLHYWQSMKLN
jgi:hypothetical protein